jgi:hypothetical protein
MYRGAILILALVATDAAAQSPKNKAKSGLFNDAERPRYVHQPPRYVKFPIDGDPEQMLSEFLKTKSGEELIQKFVQDKLHKLLEKPPEFLDKLIRDQAAGDPAMRELVDNFLKNHPELKKGEGAELGDAFKKIGKQLEGNKKFAEEIVQGLEKKLGPEGLKKEMEIDGFVPPDLPVEPVELPRIELPLEEEMTDPFGEWLTELLKDGQFERTVMDHLANAPDLKEAVGDLILSLKGPEANGNWMPKIPEFGTEKWGFDLTPPKLPFEMGQFPKLPSLTMPQLPNLPMPRLGNLRLPQMPGFGGVPNVHAPNVSVGGEWTYIIFTLLAGVLAWWFARNLKWAPRPDAAAQIAALRKALPKEITTRTELRQAFDALALSLLGEKARSWNHRLIGRHLAGGPQSVDAAQVIANLYEMARYTPGDDRLSRVEQDAVRASLAVLTGGPA